MQNLVAAAILRRLSEFPARVVGLDPSTAGRSCFTLLGIGLSSPPNLKEVFVSPTITLPNVQRRTFVSLAFGSGLAMSGIAALAQQATDSAAPLEAEFKPKLKRALVISNGDYLVGKALLPARKNLVDMKAALEGVGFDVDAYLDLSQDELKKTVAAYARKLKADKIDLASGESVLVFYFFGHGLEVDGINYLVPAKSDPVSKEAVDKSVRLQQDVLDAFPTGYPGVTLAFIDACRIGFNTDKDKDLSQIKPPAGVVIMYGSRAGRPAISPKSETRNSFFTASLVDTFRQYDGTGSIYDLCISAETLCLETVTKEFKRLNISVKPQHPQTAANLRGNFKLEAAKDSPPAAPSPEAEKKAWDDIQRTLRPKDLRNLCDAFLKAYPLSQFVQWVKVRRQGAQAFIDAKEQPSTNAPIRITWGALDDKAGSTAYREDLAKAFRGDKDAALRIADAYRDGRAGVAKTDDRYEAWLRLSYELGSGIAAAQLYELAKSDKLSGEGAGSKVWLKRAIERGYSPPKELNVQM